jgi:hypothetical protein
MNAFTNYRYYTLFQRVGAASFAFFLVKGLLWLIAPFVFLWFA